MCKFTIEFMGPHVSSADSIVDLQKKSARELYQIHIYIYI